MKNWVRNLIIISITLILVIIFSYYYWKYIPPEMSKGPFILCEGELELKEISFDKWSEVSSVSLTIKNLLDNKITIKEFSVRLDRIEIKDLLVQKEEKEFEVYSGEEKDYEFKGFVLEENSEHRLDMGIIYEDEFGVRKECAGKTIKGRVY